MQKTYILLLTLICIFSCKKKEEQPKDNEPNTNTEKVDLKETPSNLTLLQGNWQNVDDPKSKMSFNDNLWIDTYEGMKEISKNTFELGNNCKNVIEQKVPEVKNAYISIPKLNQCYKIEKIDKNYLELSYVGRGNSLKYERID